MARSIFAILNNERTVSSRLTTDITVPDSIAVVHSHEQSLVYSLPNTDKQQFVMVGCSSFCLWVDISTLDIE